MLISYLFINYFGKVIIKLLLAITIYVPISLVNYKIYLNYIDKP